MQRKKDSKKIYQNKSIEKMGGKALERFWVRVKDGKSVKRRADSLVTGSQFNQSR
jgi:hypothetical protein